MLLLFRNSHITTTCAENWGRAFLGWAGSPSDSVRPGARPTSVPSGILIHPVFGHNRHGSKMGEGLCPFFGGSS